MRTDGNRFLVFVIILAVAGWTTTGLLLFKQSAQTPSPKGDSQAIDRTSLATSHPPEDRAAFARLTCLRGLKPGIQYPLYKGENYIGRADEKPVDIDLDDQEAPDRIWSSKQHARVVCHGGQMTIEDLNSTNGTFVNRKRVFPGKTQPEVDPIVKTKKWHSFATLCSCFSNMIFAFPPPPGLHPS